MLAWSLTLHELPGGTSGPMLTIAGIDVTPLMNAPVANMLIVLGAGFMLLGVVGKMRDVALGPLARAVSALIGVGLVIGGICIHMSLNREQSAEETSGHSLRDPSATLVENLIESAQFARWSNGHVDLKWSGSRNDTLGFAVWVDSASLGDGTQRPRVLETHPTWIREGQIIGEFTLKYPIQPGDKFISDIGFIRDGSGTVEFVVEAYGGRHSGVQRIGSRRLSGDDRQIKPMDIDLTPFAGVRTLRLVVRAGQQSFEDWAVWIGTRIEH